MTSLENEITTAEAEFDAWHRKRNDALAEDFGLLTLTSFQWLAAEPSAVDLVPGLWSADLRVAALNAGASDGFVTYDGGTPVRGILTKTVAERSQTMWVRWCGGTEAVAVELARRDGRYLIRTRAASTPAQQDFSGVPVFDFDPDWIIKGSYVPYLSPQVARISTARSDTSLTAVLAGGITFNYQGSSYRLQAEFEPETGALRVTFRDATNGLDTAAWRFLDVPPPALDGTVLLDFNRAQNYPFAFTEYAVCPAPVAANQLPFAVTAGEKLPV
ncbi:DUF1684 domain-containing protein [Crystallibacter degradans]|uniref:DUF1684 domain-containing protein n=1 Tax=Crystallibacter degradans TaxID=2726743 RepID=UPI001472FBD7|nr:DUF1684 domain-containing protein [Arthrobacter sp. SF27]NMR29278.1 DUF1684 domain-containing protein [Arthrobacter sp. SF27]